MPPLTSVMKTALRTITGKKPLVVGPGLKTGLNIKLDNPAAEELRAWQARSGMPLRKFFNTSGQLYRALGLKEKLPAMGEEEMLSLLASDGMLVKRPLLVGEDFTLVGFREADWAARLGG